jgi:hypothetical protein
VTQLTGFASCHGGGVAVLASRALPTRQRSLVADVCLGQPRLDVHDERGTAVLRMQLEPQPADRDAPDSAIGTRAGTGTDGDIGAIDGCGDVRGAGTASDRTSRLRLRSGWPLDGSMPRRPAGDCRRPGHQRRPVDLSQIRSC